MTSIEYPDVRNLPVTTWLIIANIAVYAIVWMSGGESSQLMPMFILSTSSMTHGGAITIFTSLFMHASISHLLGNMFSLFVFGMMTEKLLGSKRFIAVYIVSGLCGNITYLLVRSMLGMTTGLVGASGAIIGLFGAWMSSFLSSYDARDAARRQAAVTCIIVLVANVMIDMSSTGVAVDAHIGGFIAGFVLYKLFTRNR